MLSQAELGSKHEMSPGAKFLTYMNKHGQWREAADAYARVRPATRQCMQSEVGRLDLPLAQLAAASRAARQEADVASTMHVAALRSKVEPLEDSVFADLDACVRSWLAHGSTDNALTEVGTAASQALSHRPAACTHRSQLATLHLAKSRALNRPSKHGRRARARAHALSVLEDARPLQELQLPAGSGAALPVEQHALLLALPSSQHRLMLHGLAAYYGLDSVSMEWSPPSRAPAPAAVAVTLLRRKAAVQTVATGDDDEDLDPVVGLAASGAGQDSAAAPGGDGAGGGGALPPLPQFLQHMLRARALKRLQKPKTRAARGRGASRPREAQAAVGAGAAAAGATGHPLARKARGGATHVSHAAADSLLHSHHPDFEGGVPQFRAQSAPTARHLDRLSRYAQSLMEEEVAALRLALEEGGAEVRIHEKLARVLQHTGLSVRAVNKARSPQGRSGSSQRAEAAAAAEDHLVSSCSAVSNIIAMGDAMYAQLGGTPARTGSRKRSSSGQGSRSRARRAAAAQATARSAAAADSGDESDSSAQGGVQGGDEGEPKAPPVRADTPTQRTAVEAGDTVADPAMCVDDGFPTGGEGTGADGASGQGHASPVEAVAQGSGRGSSPLQRATSRSSAHEAAEGDAADPE